MMIFAFLRPGITPQFESNALIYIIESNLINENTWRSISFPVAVHKILNDTLSIELKQDPSSDWKFANYYFSPNVHDIDVTLSPNNIKITCTTSFACKTVTDPTDPSSAGIYFIVVEKDPPLNERLLNISDKCNPEALPIECDYSIGSKEIFEGINENRLLDLTTNPNNYQAKKVQWGFPEAKDFSVTLDYLDGSQPLEILSPEFPPSDQANVFVKEISMQILNPDSTREPAKINIKVW